MSHIWSGKPENIDAPDTKSANVSTLDRLQMNLFVNYDVNVQPTIQGKAANVSLGLSVNYIDIDELNGKITLHCWLNVVSVDCNKGTLSQSINPCW